MGLPLKMIFIAATVIGLISACGAADVPTGTPEARYEIAASQPIQPHPENPRYFLFRGKPAVLVSPAEHYGAVMNMDFDYIPYLDTLAANGFNLTRVFVGPYLELEKSIPFVKGYDNTLAPKPERLLVPWARSETPGYYIGGNKFDLDRWDEAFFSRLRNFIVEAGRRGIVVEVVLFSQQYDEKNWAASPMNAVNNVNGLPQIRWHIFNTVESEPLVVRQEELVRKVVKELAPYDNIYFEICNEPNFQTVGVKKSAAWALRMLNAIYGAEDSLTDRHMIAFQDASVLQDPRISVYNFHYAIGSNWVGAMQALKKYYGLGKVLAFDETSDVLAGQPLSKTRIDGWQFLLGGGAVYDHLSWVYTPENEAGDSELGVETRKQFRVLKEFIGSLDFLKMQPANGIQKAKLPKNTACYILAETGKTYAVHIAGGSQTNLKLELPAGQYNAEWIDTKTGAVVKSEPIAATEATTDIASPSYQDDIALRLRRQ